MTTVSFVILIVFVALVFDFVNGWHDAANSVATIVSTRVLPPGIAVIWAAFFNFIAFALFGTRVAKMIGGDLVNIDLIEPEWRLWTLLCALIGATIWDVLTWYFGLPSSSSHALIGGLGGAAIAAHGGFGDGLLKADGWIKTLAFIVVSPVLGMILGGAVLVAIMWLFRSYSPRRVDHWFRKLQLGSAALYSLGHGGNDAQKTMGIIAGVLVASNLDRNATTEIPLWVVLACHAAMALGTLSGGWRIVHTMGGRLTRLRPVGGFAAETAGAITLFMATHGGIPVSTTHTITGAIVGVGSVRRRTAVRWSLARRVVWAWVFTIPVSGLVAAACLFAVSLVKSVL